MEGKNNMMMVMIIMMMMVMRIVVGQGANDTSVPTPVPFIDCYGRCFFFCIIVPTNACTCTSTCLKKCLDTPSMTTTMALDDHHAQKNLGFCKLGCAHSLCGDISTRHNPDEQGMGRCVDSCSNKCSMSYSLSP
ncbi:thionin-like protein 2 [Tanacetum coccineum]